MYDHDFLVVPSAKSAMLISVDLWARTPIILRAPPAGRCASTFPKCAVTQPGLANRTTEEGHRLETFLAEELKKFDDVSGPTDRGSHHIRVKPGVQPIKQRYRPRNPAMQEIINQEVENGA